MTDPLKLDTLVELIDQYSDVYPVSPTGALGWVRARREMPKSDPEVYIEWDKQHWRYHGEFDGWTFEHHFRPATDVTDVTEAASALSNMGHILDRANEQLDSERCPTCGGLHDDDDDEFLTTLMEAQDAALGSDGYFVVTLTPREANGMTFYQPDMFSHTLNATAKGMIEAQLVHIAAQLFANNMMDRVNEIDDDDLGPLSPG